MHIANPNRYVDLHDPQHEVPTLLWDLYEYLYTHGDRVFTRTGTVKEVIGVSFTLYSEELLALKKYFEKGEHLGYPFNVLDKKSSSSVFSRGFQKDYEGRLLTGAAIPIFCAKAGEPYYARAIKAAAPIVTALQADPMSRQTAVLISEKTCFNSYSLQLRNNRLHLILNARSLNLSHGAHRDIRFWDEHLLTPTAIKLGAIPHAITLNVANLHISVT